MRKLLIAAALSLAACTTLTGCPTVPTEGQSSQVVVPKDQTQAIYASTVSLTTATNALADLNKSGVVTGANYTTAYEIQKRASGTLAEARKANAEGNATKAEVLLRTLTGLIDQLAIYNGGRK